MLDADFDHGDREGNNPAALLLASAFMSFLPTRTLIFLGKLYSPAIILKF
jgi:hypothetical protein